MAAIVYTLCAVVAAACAVLLLLRAGTRRSKMLFWSGSCFAVLFLTNVLAVVDVASPGQDYTRWRLLSALAAICLLLYGLIFEDD